MDSDQLYYLAEPTFISFPRDTFTYEEVVEWKEKNYPNTKYGIEDFHEKWFGLMNSLTELYQYGVYSEKKKDGTVVVYQIVSKNPKNLPTRTPLKL